MKISEAIKMFEEALAKHGDAEVYIDMDYGGERQLERDDDPLTPCPDFQDAAGPLPPRIVI